MNYQEAIEYIHSINWCFCKPGLERIGELCTRLGNPQNSLRFIHVAGTNGKGSFCSMTESVLRHAGLKTGLYTSPYIVDFCERMQINGENIPKDTLAEITEYVRPIADSMKDKPTEFELITAVAFEYFKREKCDIVILEAGLGGRLDSTNIITTPILSVITGIALDHTAILGDSIKKIAAEKAGIIKKGVPVLFGGEDNEAKEVIAHKAEEMSSSLSVVNYNLLKNINATLDGTEFDYKDRTNVKIKLLGLYQPKNAAVVLDAIDILRSIGLEISDEAVKKGLLAACWHARFEKLSDDPLTIFDGAHNPQGIRMAIKSIKHYFKDQKVCILSGVLKDKDYKDIAESLSCVACHAFTVTPQSERALDGRAYADVLKNSGIDAEYGGEIKAAYKKAELYAKNHSLPLICLGSLYLYVSII